MIEIEDVVKVNFEILRIKIDEKWKKKRKMLRRKVST